MRFDVFVGMKRLKKAFVVSILCFLLILLYEWYKYGGLQKNQFVYENKIELLGSELIDFKSGRLSNEFNLSVQIYYEKRKVSLCSHIITLIRTKCMFNMFLLYFY